MNIIFNYDLYIRHTKVSAIFVKNMAKAKIKNTGKLRSSKRKVKRPNMQSPQNCVLNSTSKAKSRKKQKMRESSGLRGNVGKG